MILSRLALAAFAATAIAAAPAATPKPTAKPASKPAAAKTPAKAKATPKAAKTPAVKVVATPAPSPTPDEPAVMDGERRLATGEATWKLGKEERRASAVQGTIQQSGGFKIAAIKFPTGKKEERLKIEFMYEGPGPVNQGYLTTIFAVDENGRYHAFKKGVSDCNVNLAKATALEVQGTMSCPKGLLDEENKPAKPIVDVKFHAKADPKSAAAATPAP